MLVNNMFKEEQLDRDRGIIVHLARELATDEAEAVMYRALSKGLSFKLTMGNILTLTPPLIITQKEMDQALMIIEECLDILKPQ